MRFQAIYGEDGPEYEPTEENLSFVGSYHHLTIGKILGWLENSVGVRLGIRIEGDGSGRVFDAISGPDRGILFTFTDDYDFAVKANREMIEIEQLPLGYSWAVYAEYNKGENR